MKFTATTLRSIALPPGIRDKIFFDDELPGFGLRLRASGSQIWTVQYKIGVKHRRLSLGTVTEIDIGKARSTAKDLLAKVRLGEDPFAVKLEQRAKMAECFGALLPRYLARQRARLKPRSLEEVERHLVAHAKPFHSRGIDNIDRRAVAMLLADIDAQSGPAAANRVRASLSGFFMWLVREGLLQANPVAVTNKSVENGSRERVLDDSELAAIWRGLEHQHGSILKLLILTGARRAEIGDLRWSEIDFENAMITLPPARTKNKRPHEIPLSSAALAILRAQPRNERDFVFGRDGGSHGFQDWSGAKATLDARCGIKKWVVHDFRRTVSTVMHDRLGVMPHVVEAVLGHVDGHKGGVAGIYNRSSYIDQKIVALDKWAAHIDELVHGKRSAEVVKLRRRK
jgi:integrase